MKRFRLSLMGLTLLLSVSGYAQTAITSTDTLAAQVMMGNFNPTAYAATTVIDDPAIISAGVQALVSSDSLHAYLDVLRSFQTRNTGSDTMSADRGIGAARRWVFSKFQQFSAENDNRLISSYLQFDQLICGMERHRNVFAVLPGADTSDKSVTIIEAHMDSRCAGLCDTGCIAEGMEDNGSGTALVLELARVMSRYTYKRTLVFVTTTSEEQGLNGATAFAKYADDNNIKIRGVLNNDVIGGVTCGHTSSPPSCPGFKDIDSTQVRLFSYGGFNSFHKGLCRYIKLEYKEMIRPTATVPMDITIMTAEDRTGRGGDHIPFRQKGFTAMRFTAANESGDANVSSGTYADRQHTSSDSLGIDTDMDGTLDEYYVDFNYLARNTVINANAAAMMAVGPRTPDFTLTSSLGNLNITLITETGYPAYRVGVRTTTNDWDTVYTVTGGPDFSIPVDNGNHIVSVASVDANGIESLFSKELQANVNGIDEVLAKKEQQPLQLMQNKPNPADEATMISVLVNGQVAYKRAYVSIKDMSGKEVKRMDISLNMGMNEIVYEHGYNATGQFVYTLVVDGAAVASKTMVFAN